VGFLRIAQGVDKTRALLDAFVAWMVVAYVSAETFGLWGLIGFYPFLILWISLTGFVLCTLWKYRGQAEFTLPRPRALPLLIIISFVAISLFICLTAEPNNYDSQVYHLPRIEHWLQNGSLTHYPTFDYRQNAHGPLAEVLLLHTRVLAESDLFYLLVQWISMVCSVTAVFRVTQQLGGNETQSWIAAIFATTLPMGIVQSNSTQNDYVAAALLACFVSLGLEVLKETRVPIRLASRNFALLLEMAIAGAMSGLVKPTAYVIGSGFAFWLAVALIRKFAFRRLASFMVASSIVFVVFVGPFSFRNAMTYGSISPNDAILRNGSFGIQQTLSNLAFNVGSNLAVSVPEINAFTTRVALRIASSLNFQKYQKDILFLEQPFMLPSGTSVLHEDVTPNPAHTLLIGASLLMAAFRWRTFYASRLGPYTFAWVFGVLVYSATLRWQIWGARLQLPAFILAAPLVAMVWQDRRLYSKYTLALLLILTCSGIPALLLNFSRPLVSFQGFPPSFLAQDPIQRLFANKLGAVDSYVEAVDALTETRASQIGLVFDLGGWEYPIWRMLRDRKLDYPLRLEHVSLSTPSEHTWPLGSFVPQALIRVGSSTDLSITVQGKRFLRVSGPSLVATFAPFERVPSVREIDVPTNRLSGAAFSRGWSTSESWGIWTIGSEAQIDIAAPLGPLILTINARGFGVSDGSKGQVVEVLVNGRNLGRMTFDTSDSKTSRFEVPSDLDTPDHIMHILFRISNPSAPSEFDAKNPDTRLLGLGLIRLGLQKLN
jgi:hypothetical protein